MKLSPDEVDRIVRRVLREWLNQKVAAAKVPEEKIHQKLNEIFLKELRVEDGLNAEVETMLTKYEKEFASGKLDRRKMFLLIKNQLVKERRIIL
ncbi:MAG: DUF507 family protein [Pseudomonadota bacterium]